MGLGTRLDRMGTKTKRYIDKQKRKKPGTPLGPVKVGKKKKPARKKKSGYS